MSETDRFKFAGRGKNVPFPFCYASSVPTGWDYTGGLDLTQICGVWWSFESLVCGTSGTFGTFPEQVEIDSGFTAPSGVLVTQIETNSFCDTGESSARVPKTRVCVESDYAVSFYYDDTDIYGNPRNFTLNLRVGVDPDDSDFFAILYRFSIDSHVVSGDASIAIVNPEQTSEWGTGTPSASGTLVLGGIPINWVGGGRSLMSFEWVEGAVGMNMDITPSYFTYPAP